MENKEILKRWRLILGSCCEDTMDSLGGTGAMSEEDMLMDSALSQIYGGNSDGSSSGMAGSVLPRLTPEAPPGIFQAKRQSQNSLLAVTVSGRRSHSSPSRRKKQPPLSFSAGQPP